MPNPDYALRQNYILKGDHIYSDFEVISRGGFGITYKVKASYFLGRIKQTSTFAVKEYFPKDYAKRNADGSVSAIVGKEKDFQECFDEFLREGRMLHELSHQGIVPVNEVIESNGTIYYVMQYLGDMNLTRYVSEHGGRLAEGEARRVMSKLLDAVGYLHSQRLNHLDIKPDNVMMTDSENGDKVPVLIDFGVSKHFHANGKQTSRLGGKGVTDGYSPLEQYLGIKSFSPMADVYALGATFFYMLTGLVPLDASDVSEQWLRKNLPSRVSQETVDAICHAMTRDGSSRTSSVIDFYKQLGDVIESEHWRQTEFVSENVKPDKSISMTILKNQGDTKKNGRTHFTIWFLLMAIIVLAGFIAFVLDMSSDQVSDMLDNSAADYTDTLNDAIKANDPIRIQLAIEYVLQQVENEQESGRLDQAKRTLKSLRSWLTVNAEEVKSITSDHVAVRELISKVGAYKVTSSIDDLDFLIFQVKGVDFRMIHVKGGTFKMGATNDQGENADIEEKPVHSVELSNYLIGETEVTQELWNAVMDSNPSYNQNNRKPVERVSWYECKTFIKQLNVLTGQNFRLPTEAEWEYAARGGIKSKHYKYSGSNILVDVAWFVQNSGQFFIDTLKLERYESAISDNYCESHLVATKQPNELGLYDMSGNVEEWCEDLWDENYYTKSPYDNPKGPEEPNIVYGEFRICRGGSFLRLEDYCRSAHRNYATPYSISEEIGFRLALSSYDDTTEL